MLCARGTGSTWGRRVLTALAVLGATLSGLPARADLQSVGPVDERHGFPVYYEDSEGLRLELCLDNNGLCLEPLPNPAAEPSVPGNFPEEAFWWAAEASMPTSGEGEALLVLASEAAWLNEVPEPGQQMSFSRLRIRVDNLVDGAFYTITHPYGQEVIQAVGSGRRGINFTRDIGCTSAPCDFSLALGGDIGPFLRWDPAEEPAAPPGYIGDPRVPHTVVGSPTGNNLFRIEGPDVGGPGVDVIETRLFAVQGKVMSTNAPIVQVSPDSVDFGNQLPLTTSAPRTVTLSNVGSGPATLGAPGIGGTHAADFAIRSTTCGTTLPAGSTCTVRLTFTPRGLGARSGQLNLPIGSSTRTVPLSGNGAVVLPTLR